MFFSKKKSDSSSVHANLRRRFHHFLIAKRKNHSSKPVPKGLPKKIAPRRHTKNIWSRLNSPEVRQVRSLAFFILIGGILIAAFYIIFFSSFFTITKVAIEKSGSAVPETSIISFLERLKGKNILFIKTDSLTKEIEQTFKNEILLVKFKKSYPRTIVAEVQEYPAVINLKIIASDKTQKFVLNQIGYCILENTELKNLPVLIWQTDKSFSGKSIMIKQEKLALIADAFKRFTEIFGIKIIYGEWKKVQRELHLKTEKNFDVWFDLTSDVPAQILKLKKALPKLDIFNTPLEYIDLRIAGGDSEKVIYKRK
ncbi:hypothetical protein HZC21_01815 [Candidatus Peregrinibacteria bacterium]|nr:hypothetical protein [Candidatus Peregrinibacteria bacterium]